MIYSNGLAPAGYHKELSFAARFKKTGQPAFDASPISRDACACAPDWVREIRLRKFRDFRDAKKHHRIPSLFLSLP